METLKMTILVVLIPFGWLMSDAEPASASSEKTEVCRLQLDPVNTAEIRAPRCPRPVAVSS